MSEFEIKNAIIESTQLGLDRGTFFTFWLHLDYGGSGQGAGGYVLGKESDEKTEGCTIGVIADLLDVIGVERWEDLPGKHIRVEASMGKVKRIGNILKDKWFSFDDITQYISPSLSTVEIKPKRITITKRTHDYHTYIGDNKGLWGCGGSIYEAIGNVIVNHPEKLDIELKDENGDDTLTET